jgi:hypothetical protein
MAMRLNKAVIASKIFIAASAITVASLLWRVSLLYQMIDATGTQDKGQIAWITSRADNLGWGSEKSVEPCSRCAAST